MHARFLAAFLAGAAPMAPAASLAQGPALLIHGNYCGPGNNAPLPPVDAVDAACAQHDACTPSGGLPSAGCNARLRAELDAIAHDPAEAGDLRALAGLYAAGSALIPSSGTQAQARSVRIPVGRPGLYPGETLPGGAYDDSGWDLEQAP